MTLRSLWQDRHDTFSGPQTRDQTVDQTVEEVGGEHDVVVVGGGLTGLTTALLLSRAGCSVLVLEARTIGAGTTGGSTAKVSLLQGTQLTRIAHRHPQSLLQDYVTANLEAQAWVTQFCSTHGVGLQHRPAYTYATTASGEAAARREHDHALEAGLDVQWLDDVPLPFATRGAVHLADQRQLDPIELLGALADEAIRHGARIIEGARVRRVRGRAPVRVETDHGTALAGTVVVATNMPVLDRGAFFARLSPARSYGLAFRTAVQSVDGMYLSTDAASRSLRDAPVGPSDADPTGSLLLVGGNGHTTGRAPSPRARLETLRAWTREHFDVTDETHAWSAQDYVPHHGLPYAGPVLPGRDDLLVAGGFAKWGMTNGVASALLLSARILGEAPAWGEAFRTWSPRELRGLPTASRINAEVGLALTSGWLKPLLTTGTAPPPPEGAGRVGIERFGAPTATSTTDGVTRRVSAVCTHLGGIVAWNDAERSWDCPLHGSRFDTDGTVLEGVATCGLRKRDGV